ncbi:MAG: phosphoenolpyruvate carboxylase, partial [Algisphaera sp.]
DWYADLVPDTKAGRHVGQMLKDDMKLTQQVILKIIERDTLLDGAGWLRRAVEARDPYVDVLNLIQVELMGRRAKSIADQDAEALIHLDRALRQTVQGIAAGLRGTG